MTSIALVVDDEPLLLDVVSNMLEILGWEVRTAEKALAQLAADPLIATLITDVQMPGVDGYELAKRASSERPGLCIFVMSGRDPGRKGYAFIRKPFTLGELSRVIGGSAKA